MKLPQVKHLALTLLVVAALALGGCKEAEEDASLTSDTSSDSSSDETKDYHTDYYADIDLTLNETTSGAFPDGKPQTLHFKPHLAGSYILELNNLGEGDIGWEVNTKRESIPLSEYITRITTVNSGTCEAGQDCELLLPNLLGDQTTDIEFTLGSAQYTAKPVQGLGQGTLGRGSTLVAGENQVQLDPSNLENFTTANSYYSLDSSEVYAHEGVYLIDADNTTDIKLTQDSDTGTIFADNSRYPIYFDRYNRQFGLSLSNAPAQVFNLSITRGKAVGTPSAPVNLGDNVTTSGALDAIAYTESGGYTAHAIASVYKFEKLNTGYIYGTLTVDVTADAAVDVRFYDQDLNETYNCGSATTLNCSEYISNIYSDDFTRIIIVSNKAQLSQDANYTITASFY